MFSIYQFYLIPKKHYTLLVYDFQRQGKKYD